MNPTTIEWVVGADGKPGFTWNPIVGCSKGCPYCYARRIATTRLAHLCEKCARFEPHLHSERLGEPAKRKKPTGIFVCSMGELFEPHPPTRPPAPDLWRVLWEMENARRHRYYLLTKRPDDAVRTLRHFWEPNWWIGASVSTQAEADERIPQLLRLREHGDWSVLFVSVEPMLGPVDLRLWSPCPLRPTYKRAGCLDWVIIGGQTGPGAALPEVEWLADLTTQCRFAGVPVFHKENLGALDLLGLAHPIQEWPRVEGE